MCEKTHFRAQEIGQQDMIEIELPHVNRLYQMLWTVVIVISLTSLSGNVEMMHFCDCVVFLLHTLIFGRGIFTSHICDYKLT